MSYHTAILVPGISHGTQTHLYDGGGEYDGAAVPAASYYSNVGNSQTVLYSLNDFDGTIEIQGTLTQNPADTDWTVLFTIPAGTPSGVQVIPGRFSGIRAVVREFTAGVINDIRIVY